MSPLTASRSRAYPYLVPAKSGIGIDTPSELGAPAPSAIGAFFMPLSMAGCMEQPQGWPVPSSGSVNFIQSATLCLTPEVADSSLSTRSPQHV